MKESKYQEEDRKNHEILEKKYERERVVIYTGAAWERWNKQTVLRGMGGSETWAVELAEQLYKKGYAVTVYNDLDVDEKFDEGVRYRHYSKLLEDLSYVYIDYFIASRTCETWQWNLHTHKRFVMIHDIWISADTNYNVYLDKVTKYAILSDWHRDFVSQHHKIPKEKMFLTANGVDQSLYTAKVEKKNKIFYSSSLDRGLRELLLWFPRIRQAVPDLELVVAYGLDNWEKAMTIRNNANERAHYEEVKRLLQQPGVKYLGRVSKAELAKHQLESKAWLYPTWFQETFCITAVEAGLADCAVLTSRLAGLITTVDNAGILLDGSSYSVEYQNAFVEASIKLLTDETYRLEWARKAHERMIRYSWDSIANAWISEFKNEVSTVPAKSVSVPRVREELAEGRLGGAITRSIDYEEILVDELRMLRKKERHFTELTAWLKSKGLWEEAKAMLRK